MLLLAYGTQQLLFQVNKCWMLYLSGCACLFRLWSGYLPFDLSFLIGPGKVIEFPFSQLFLLWGKVWRLLSSLHIRTEHRFFFFLKFTTIGNTGNGPQWGLTVVSLYLALGHWNEDLRTYIHAQYLLWQDLSEEWMIHVVVKSRSWE